MAPKKVTEKKKRLVLLDAHAILHRAYHALPDFSTSKGEPTGGLYGLGAMLIRLVNDLKPDYLIAAYDLPEPTFRREAYDAYKAGRQKADDALVAQIERSREIFKAFHIPIYEKAGFEADDILGTVVETLKDEDDLEIIIASGDMDTLQLVDNKRVQVYTLKKGLSDIVLYDEKAVKDRFGFGPELLPDFKGLRGDPSDNIIGVKGIGEKTATTLIQNFGSIEKIYKQLKKDPQKIIAAGCTPRIVELLKNGEEEAQFSKMLGTIRRDAPIEFALPEKTWREMVDISTIESLFRELEFRSLAVRVRDQLGFGQGQLIAAEEEKEAEVVDPEEFKKLAIAVWLLDSTMTNPSLEDILHAAKAETFTAAREKVFAEIEKKNLKKVYTEIELPLVPVVEKMERKGVKIDVEYLKKLSTEYRRVLTGIESDIFDMAGMTFNVNSPRQLGDVLYDKMGLGDGRTKKTATGQKSTRESELEKLRDIHPIIGKILEYREFQKLLSTYIETIPTVVDEKSRLHARFSQTGTTTGRMSSNSPNLQNIPIKTELGRAIRHAFVADKSCMLLALDYSQIELRVAALLSGDEKLTEIFKNGKDVHAAVASQVFGVSIENVDREMRRVAKVINFGILYGMGVNALKANLGTDRADAQKFYNEYFKQFSGLASYLEKVKAEAEKKGYTETYFGRRRNFSDIRSPLPYIKAAAERMAINAPIQGTQADIIKLAMVKIDTFFEEKGYADSVSLILQVHDELIYEIDKKLAEELAPKVKEIMESIIPPEEARGIPFIANASVGTNWGDLKAL